MSKKKTIIFDLDGTLALIDKRRELAMKSGKMDWDVFFNPANIHLDEPNKPVIELYNACAMQGHPTMIFSGRSDRMRMATLKWLAKELPTPSKDKVAMRMRREGDYTPDDELKRKWFDFYFKKDEVLFVVDDRDKVVKMWRDMGLTCLQVADGNF